MCFCSMMIGGNYRIKLINKIVELSNNITVVRSNCFANHLTSSKAPISDVSPNPNFLSPPKSLNDQSSSQDSASSGFRSGAWTRSFEIPSVLNRARLIEASPLIGMMTSKSSLLQEIFSRRVNYILSFAYLAAGIQALFIVLPLMIWFCFAFSLFGFLCSNFIWFALEKLGLLWFGDK